MKRCKVTLVCGSSIDGKISPRRGMSSKEFGSYLSEGLEIELHKIRSGVDGILVSVNTIITDDPSLTIRGLQKFKKVARIILDREGKIPDTSKVLNKEAKTIILTGRLGMRHLKKLDSSIDILLCDEIGDKIDLRDAFCKLHEKGINNLLVEGGGTLNKSLFSESLLDRFIIFYFPFIVGGKETPTVVDGKDSFYPTLIKMNLLENKRMENVVINTYEIKK